MTGSHTREHGSNGRYVYRDIVSFRYNSTGPVLDQIRDGRSGLVESVTRESAGLYTVALRTDRPKMPREMHIDASLHQAAAPTVYADVHPVVDSWDPDAGTFQVQVMVRSTEAVAAAASDPDNGDRISVELVGSYNTVGQDSE